MKKCITLPLLVVLLFSQLNMAFATTQIDRETAIEMAISSSKSKEELKDSYMASHQAAASLYRVAEQQENAEENYDAMVEMMTQMNIPLKESADLTGEETFDAFYSMRVQYESVNAQDLALKDALDTVDLNITAGVDKMMTGLLSLSETVALQSDYIKIQEELMADAETQYALGLLSENAYKEAKADYQIALYQRIQSAYAKENLEMQFKQMLGLGIDDQIILHDDYLSPDASRPSLETYQSKALEERIDIKRASYQLDAAEAIYDYRLSAIYDLMDAFKANMAIEKAKADLEDVKLAVYKDVLEAYNAVNDAKKELDIAQKRYEVRLASQQQAQISYEQGLIKDTDLALSEFATKQEFASLKSDIRTLYLAIETLNNKMVVQ